ncbi:Zinc finger, PHD-type,Zinc finger, RING-type,Zinc finger, FYVE/PHD-type,Ubiquitin-related [Cinara cedri]|uniref:RING-type E3 ubiquitin transferase n=1 Tax=Cinara cedri TaxID=506608 RepID=A0A5E4NQA0_9HEMI|nr:Zinc finger, PHD-type,Zinc finger, RING-type,Zinc finger, FYVE/PHD-type,Ubiquitin-related [Cinara cedri]
MFIKIRSVGLEEKNNTFEVSRTLKVLDLKQIICQRLKIEPDVQRLFFCGKQLENNYTLFDYNINQTSVIQLVVREPPVNQSGIEKKSLPNSTEEEPCCSSATSSTSDERTEDKSEESCYFKIGDYVDVKDSDCGFWLIGKLLKIKKDTKTVNLQDPNSPVQNDGLIYVVGFYQVSETTEVNLQAIRPHASEKIDFGRVTPGNKLLMNYNIEYPKERGYWYDVIVKEVKTSRRCNEVIGDIIVGIGKAVLKNCHLTFVDEIYTLKPYTLLVNRTSEDDKMMQMEPVMRAAPLYCIACKDNLKKCCKECGCRICGGKDNEDRQIMCDECDHPYHMLCLDPPMEAIPEDDNWYCPTCKTDENIIVGAGQELKNVKIKKSNSNRDWGKGYACVGRAKICNIVPIHHFGPIPGIEVGTSWLFRLQASESGVHRPSVGGIHGRDKVGAFSIVFSGGYEDDVDYGEEFLYTGSGGRQLKTENKRTANQSFDQELTRSNRALAINCNAELDDVNGAEAKNWKEGKPVRVLRSSRSKHSKFAPELGYRYDGIYKVVKYYPARGLSGFNVWRFVLRRDDIVPAPWTKKGKERIIKHNLKIIYPENYEEKISSSKGKRALTENFESNEPKSGPSKIEGNTGRMNKKIRITYELEPELKDLIASDTVNKKYWVECKDVLVNGKKVFLEKVEETFKCACCQDIVFNPITTKCKHNICKNCLQRSFALKVFQCPWCRTDLDKNCSMNVNKKLASTLLFLFPGYNTDR